MKKILYFIYVSALILWGGPSFAVDLSKYNHLKDLETFSSDNEIKVILNFSKQIKDIRKPQFFKKSIQFVFKDTFIVPAKMTIDIREELIPDILVYQFDESNVRLRLFLGRQDVQFENRLSYKIAGKKLIISISKKNQDLSRIENYEKMSNQVVNNEEHTGNPIGLFSERLKMDNLKPAKFIEKDKRINGLYLNESEKKIVSDIAVPNLFSLSIKIITALLIVLAVMLITYYFVKKYMLKDGFLLGKDKLVKVKSTNFIAPKKYITLVEVAGEVLVLGITATNITLLTKIEGDAIKSNRGKGKQANSDFSKQLDMVTSKTKETTKRDNSITLLNGLIQEKIDKLKTV